MFGKEKNQRDEEAKERSILEKVALEAIAEQRRRRRWCIFFKLVILCMVVIFAYNVSVSRDSANSALSTKPHLALVNVNGVIAADSDARASYIISSLKNVSEKLKKEGLEDKDIIHKLVMRSLFLLYLEDKEATTKEFYKQFSENAKTYFDILKNIDVTYNLYKRLADDFNGSLFTIDENEKNVVKSSHLELIKKCFTAGYEDTNQTELYPNWRLFDFKIIGHYRFLSLKN